MVIMKIPTKFCLNTDDYKIYFDNEKKTYVCEDLETGEKTNIGVLGTFLQMGIIKTIEDKPTNPDERVAYLMDKVVSLEQKLGSTLQSITVEKPRVKGPEIPEEGSKKQPILKKHPKTEEEEEPSINQRVMEKILEKTIEEENEENPPKEKNVNVESNEEIDNWMDI